MKSTRVYGIKYDMKSTRAFKILSIALAAAVVLLFSGPGGAVSDEPLRHHPGCLPAPRRNPVEASGWPASAGGGSLPGFEGREP